MYSLLQIPRGGAVRCQLRKRMSFGTVKPSATIPSASLNCQGADSLGRAQMIRLSPEFPSVLTVFLHRVLIEADPQAWPFAEGQLTALEAGTLGIQIGPEGIAIGVAARFHRQAIRRSCHQVAMNLRVMVWRDVGVVHAAHAGDLPPFGDPPCYSGSQISVWRSRNRKRTPWLYSALTLPSPGGRIDASVMRRSDYDLSACPPGIQQLATAAATNTNAKTTKQS
jgi:hypothetical protein